MAARATEAVKKASAQAVASPARKGGKPKVRQAKHSAGPKPAAKPASKRPAASKAGKPKPAGAKAARAAKAVKSASKPPKVKPEKAAPKAKKPARSAALALKAKKTLPSKPKTVKRAVQKQPSARPVAHGAKKAKESADKSARGARESKKTARAGKRAAEPKAAPAALEPVPRDATPAAAQGKKIQRAPAPETVAAPPASAPQPGRIVSKGVPMAPEPRSPAMEKQRMKDALAARELATKQETLYEKAVAQFNRRKFARALPLFEQAAEGPQVALSDRARVYAQICRQRSEENKIQLRNAEDYYNYGVKLLNDRELDDAAAHLSEALRRNPKAAHAHYATAVLHALNRNNAGVYESLKKAIELDPRNRHLALHDSDLMAAKRDPAIFQLLHTNVFAPPAS